MAAAGIPLLDYLLDYSPAPPDVHSEAEMHTNTRSEHYSHYDLVHDLPRWADFTLAEFKRAYAAELESVTGLSPRRSPFSRHNPASCTKQSAAKTKWCSSPYARSSSKPTAPSKPRLS
jgi:hypothetical protein